MLDSDDSDFYIGEQQKIDQEEQNIEIIKKETLQNCALTQSKIKYKLLKIENRRGHPNFHFEIDGKMYFYGIERIRAEYRIVLRCRKPFSGTSCDNNSYIAPLDLLKKIIHDPLSNKYYSKILDKSDPRVYDLKNYDINSFDIGKGHKCPGMPIDVYLNSVNKPEVKPEVKCKLVKIVNRLGYPNFQFEIDGKMYFYGILGIKKDYKITLRCTKNISGKACSNSSYIAPLDLLKQIMQDKPSKTKYAKILDNSDPRVYDLKNYDVNSFDIGNGHKCSGTEIEINKVKCKLVQIDNRRGRPKFHFEIDEKVYFYGIDRIRADYKIVLRCTKQTCYNSSFIAPLDLLKQIMQDNKSLKKKYSKIIDNSDPRVYDLKNYDIYSFDIGSGHKCPGMAIDVYLKLVNKPKVEPEVKPEVKSEMKCKLVKIVNRVGHPILHFVIDGKNYFYEIEEIKADFKIVLRCTKKFLSLSCNNLSSILPSDYLKQIIQNSPSISKYSKILDKSDPWVYDLKNYDLNSFDIGDGHKCTGTEIKKN
jgi:hypothetical protein